MAALLFEGLSEIVSIGEGIGEGSSAFSSEIAAADASDASLSTKVINLARNNPKAVATAVGSGLATGVGTYETNRLVNSEISKDEYDEQLDKLRIANMTNGVPTFQTALNTSIPNYGQLYNNLPDHPMLNTAKPVPPTANYPSPYDSTQITNINPSQNTLSYSGSGIY